MEDNANIAQTITLPISYTYVYSAVSSLHTYPRNYDMTFAVTVYREDNSSLTLAHNQAITGFHLFMTIGY